MNKLTLSNGVEIPQIGLGVWQSKTGTEAKNSIKFALEAGYRHIDTAHIYHNEKDVGQVIADSDIKREDLFITSKLWNTDHGYNQTKNAFHNSLQELKLEYLDLYLIHFPSSDKIIESWRAIEELYSDGYIKAVGVSNFHEQHLKYLMSYVSILPMVNQVEYHPYLTQKKLIRFCKNFNIQVEAWSPLGSGRFINDSNLREIACKKNKTIPQIILRWNIQNGIVTLPKSVHRNFIFENIDIFDFVLTQEEMVYIDSLNSDYHTGTNPEKFTQFRTKK